MDYKNAFDLNNKVAIITGASKGIGESMARFFAAHGAKVVISSRKQEVLEEVAESIRKESGAKVLPLAAHAGNMEQLQNLLDKTIEAFGGVDILVNNAATNPVFGPSLDCDSGAFDKIMEINVKAPFEFSKMVHASMKSRGGGSIINISSVAALTPDPGLGMYSVSKASLNMLTKVLAKEWGPDGIRVNTICPGLIKTKFSQALWQDESVMKRFTRHMPISRIGTVDEIGALALYLASDAAGFTTGAYFTADGGMTI